MDAQWLTSLSFYTKLSIWMTLAPVAFCIPVLRRMPQAVLMLFLFLTGLLTELSTQKFGASSTYSQYAFLTYSFFECTLFFCIVKYPTDPTKLLHIVRSALIFSTPLVILSTLITFRIQSTIAIFNMVGEVIIAFMTGRALLRFVEETPGFTGSPTFILLLGIFLYCFSTFFLMGVIGVTSAYKLWDPYHNTINIVTYLIYAFSFWKAYRDRPLHTL